jgi:hypothetical protein
MKLMKPPYKWTNTGQANTRATGTDGSFGRPRWLTRTGARHRYDGGRLLGATAVGELSPGGLPARLR